MHPQADAIVAAARRCLGTRFRPQGRTPGLGLDCVGVALVAAVAAGARWSELPRYALGGDNETRLDAALDAAGFTASAAASAAPGDLWVFAPVDGRRHLAVQSSTSPQPLFIHAHAGLGRVVEGPAEPSWQQIGVWRFPNGD